jgi:N-carbamoylputrescine amidase
VLSKIGTSDLRVAAVQMETKNDKSENLRTAINFIDVAAEKEADIICFHEYFLTGPPAKELSTSYLKSTAEPIPGPSIQVLCDKAKEYGVYIIAGTIIEIENDNLYNTSALIDPKGKVIGKYRKTHPENYIAKHEIGCGIKPGNEFPVFKTKFCNVGIMIDMDAAVPEVPRILSINGAELIFWPLQWSMRWARLIQPLTQAHAYMTQSYVVAANRVGRRELQTGVYPLIYGGGSTIADPEGNTLAVAPWHYPGVVVADVDLTFLRCWRNEIMPRDYPLARRPEIYETITNVDKRGV